MNKIALLSMLTCATLVGNEITLNEKDFQQYKNISNCVWENGVLTAKITGNDPYMVTVPFKEKINAQNVKCISFDMQVEDQKIKKGQFFWKNNKYNSFVSRCYIVFDIKNSGQWHSYTLDLSRNKNFTGFCTRYNW